MFAIKSGIPAPAPRVIGRPSAIKFPFADMAVGQSFFVPLHADGAEKPDEAKTVIERLRSHALRFRKSDPANEGVKFRVAEHEHPDLLVPAVGVWRTA